MKPAPAVKTVTRKVIVEKLAEVQQSTVAAAQTAVDFTFDFIIAALETGHRVELRGFGTFKVKETKARTGRNPKTGAPVAIPAKKKVTFKYHGHPPCGKGVTAPSSAPASN